MFNDWLIETNSFLMIILNTDWMAKEQLVVDHFYKQWTIKIIITIPTIVRVNVSVSL